MSLGERLREMLDPASAASGAPNGPAPTPSLAGAQAQPVNPTRSATTSSPPADGACTVDRAWAGCGAGRRLTAALVFAILTITRPGEQPRHADAAALPGRLADAPAVDRRDIFATSTPPGPTQSPTARPCRRRQASASALQVAEHGR